MRNLVTLSASEQHQVDTLAEARVRSRAETLRVLVILGLQAVLNDPSTFDKNLQKKVSKSYTKTQHDSESEQSESTRLTLKQPVSGSIPSEADDIDEILSGVSG
jgi:hypothetical protein